MSNGTFESATMTFAELLAPMTPEQFFAEYLGRKPLVLKRRDPHYFGALFTMDDVDRSIYPARQCNERNLDVIPPAGSDGAIQSFLPSSAPMHEIYAAFNSGSTIRFKGVQATWPPVANLASVISEAMSAEVNVNFYLTPEDSQGFTIHIDTHDVFVLQTGGAKIWSIYEMDDYALPLNTLEWHQTDLADRFKSLLEEDEVTLLQELRVETGDLLYIPRGVPHMAKAAADEPSLHLTVGLHPLYWVDFAKAAMELLCVQHQAFREALPHDYTRNRSTEASMAKQLKNMLLETLDDASFETTIERLVQSFGKKRSHPPEGHFGQLLRVGKLHAETEVERRPGLVCRVTSDDEASYIHFADNQVKGPRPLSQVFDFIKSQTGNFKVGDLPGLEHKSCVILCDKLIKEGLLRQAAS